MYCKEVSAITKEDQSDPGRQFHLSGKPEFISLFRELPIGALLTDRERSIQYCNPAFTKITGFSIEDIYGCNMDDILCCRSQCETKDTYDNTSESEEKKIIVCKCKTKQDFEKYIQCNKVDIQLSNGRSGIIAWYVEDLSFCEDMDENSTNVLLQRKLAIERVISFISSAFVAPENVDDVIVEALNRTGSICGASRAYLFRFDDENDTMSNTHEWNEEGVEGQKDNLQDLPQNMFPWWMSKVNKGEIIHVKEVSKMPPEAAAEKEILEMQGITSLLVLPVYVAGKVNGFIGLDNVKATGKWSTEDVSVLGSVANIIGSAIGQKEAHDELNEHNKKLRKTYEDLKNMEALKYEFISNLSHELRTPLNSIQGYSEILIDSQIGPLNEKQMRASKAVFNGSKRLNTLIDSLLYMASVLAGKTRYQFDPIQMENVIDNTLIHHNYEAAKKKITFRKEVNGSLPMIRGDVYFLPQLLYKLVDNSIKFTPENGEIVIVGKEKEHGVHIEVKDTGIGIPADKLENIFEMFYQVDGSSTRRYGGNGLGLHIAKKVVDAHNGRIWIETTEGKGTSVHIFLPADPRGQSK